MNQNQDPTSEGPQGTANTCAPTQKDPQEQIIELRWNLWSAENEINYLRGLCRQQLQIIISAENADRLVTQGRERLLHGERKLMEQAIHEERTVSNRARYLLASLFKEHTYLKDAHPTASEFYDYAPSHNPHPAPTPHPNQWPGIDPNGPTRG